MMRKSILTILLLGVTYLFAQQVDSTLIIEVSTIKSELLQQNQLIVELNERLEKHASSFSIQNRTIRSLEEKNLALKETIDSLNGIIQLNTRNIEVNSTQLGTEIEKVTSTTKTRFTQLDSSIGKNRLYWIIATLAILLSGTFIYWLLSKRIKFNKTDVETQIKNTKAALEEEGVKLDSKLVEIMEAQLKIKEEEITLQPVISNEEPDHSLALKVADEIVRMQKNISKMEKTTKGLKPLLKGIERIQNNFAANGYEMINLLNTDYDERNNIDVINFNTDESLVEGKRIISAVIKPQVNFNGVLIQRAQVDVSQN